MKHQLTFKSGSSYQSSWEVTNRTLCAMESQVEELKSLLDELYEAREDIPTACMSEKDSADYQIRLLKESTDNLNKFISIHREALNKSIVQACECYGQTASVTTCCSIPRGWPYLESPCIISSRYRVRSTDITHLIFQSSTVTIHSHGN